MALAAGDIITYDGSIWKNQPGVGGNLGVGTSSPAARLTVVGGYQSSGLSGTAAALYMASGGTSPNAAQIWWGDGSGWELHFGTQLSGAFTPRVTFVDDAVVRLSRSNDAATASVLNFRKSRGTHASPSDVQDGDTLGSIIGQARSGSYLDVGGIKIEVDGTFTSGQRPPSRVTFSTNAANGSVAERLRIDAAGNVGIGTTSPADKLHVSGGNARIANAQNLILSDNAGANGFTAIANSDNSIRLSQNNSQSFTLNAGFTSSSNNAIIFTTRGSTERMRITDGGNVGIGTAANIDSKLTFAADTVAAGGILFGTDTNLYRSAADTLKTDDGLRVGRAFAGAAVTLTDAANIATDASLGNHFRVTLGGNRILDNPTNATDAQRIIYEFIQDATGTRTITLGSAFALGTTITSIDLNGTANKRDFMECVYNSTAAKWYIVAFVKGY